MRSIIVLALGVVLAGCAPVRDVVVAAPAPPTPAAPSPAPTAAYVPVPYVVIPTPQDVEIQAAPLGDPRVRDFFNSSPRATAAVSISGAATVSFVLGPRKYYPGRVRLNLGQHDVHVRWSVPTLRVRPGQPAVWEMLEGGEQKFPILITAHGRSELVILAEPPE